MLFYRDMSPKITAREALYYALEAKYFGEQASGVGTRTDMYIATSDGRFITLDDENTIEEKLIPICYALSPDRLRKRDRKVLNELSELQGFTEIDEPQKKPNPKSTAK